METSRVLARILGHAPPAEKSRRGRSRWLSVLRGADEQARKAYGAYRQEHYQKPMYAVIEHENPADDSSPVKRAWPMNDVCGFVWLELSLKENRQFIADFKKGAVQIDDDEWKWDEFRLVHTGTQYGLGWRLDAPGIGCGNGALGAAEASARAFAEEAERHGIRLHVRSRVD